MQMMEALSSQDSTTAMEQLAGEKQDIVDDMTASEKANRVAAAAPDVHPLASQATSYLQQSGRTTQLLAERTEHEKRAMESELRLKERQIEAENKRANNERMRLELEEKRFELQRVQVENQHQVMMAMLNMFLNQ